MKIMAFNFIIFLNSCFGQNENENKIKFTLIDDNVKDNTYLTLLISNNSPYNYYLPILNSVESERWKFMLSRDESNFFFIYMVVYNCNGKSLQWHTDNCYDYEGLNNLYEQWSKKKKNIRIEDLILLESGEQIKISVPINLQKKYSKDCLWEFENYTKEKELKITYYYREKQSEQINKFLDSQIIENLKKMNFRLYDKEIESNEVRLIR